MYVIDLFPDMKKNRGLSLTRYICYAIFWIFHIGDHVARKKKAYCMSATFG